MPLIYITDKRFTGQFNENGVGLDSLSLYETYLVQLALSAVITSYCHYYYIHSRPSTPECSDIVYSVRRANHGEGRWLFCAIRTR